MSLYRPIRSLILPFFVFFSFSHGKGQIPDFQNNLQYLTIDEGLPQHEITDIFQDRHGFLWFATRGGLAKYDGYDFTVFYTHHENPNSLLSNSIECTFEDSQGHIWAGTKSGGISCFNPSSGNFFHLQHHAEDPNTLSSNRVISINEDAAGKIWIGTWDNGLNIYDPAREQFVKLLPETKVSAIAKEGKAFMWVATNRGLFKFNQSGDLLANYTIDEKVNEFTDIAQDTLTGRLWLGSWARGLISFDPETETFRAYRQEENASKTSVNNVYRVFIDRDHRLWTGTWGEGLFLFSPSTERFQPYPLNPPSYGKLNANYDIVLSIYQDRSGILWFGTEGGVCKMDESRQRFRLITKNADQKSGLQNTHITSILKASDGALWLGTKWGGLYYSQNGSDFARLNLASDAMEELQERTLDYIKAICEDHLGNLWIGSTYGLHKIRKLSNDEFEITHFSSRKGNANKNLTKVTFIYESSHGELWVGAQQEGVYRLLGSPSDDFLAFENYSPSSNSKGLLSQRVSTIIEDRNRQIWIGTFNGLYLYRRESNDFLAFSKKPGNAQALSSNIITYLYENQKGALWVGSPGGLSKIQKEADNLWHFEHFSIEDGLPSNYIHAILADDHSNLWISTNGGIAKFNPETKVFKNYDETDGLQSKAFSEGAAFKDEQGTMYFGGMYGLNYFQPEGILDNEEAPPVVLTELRINNKKIDIGEKVNRRIILERSITQTKKITLSHRENVFSIHFSALDFHAPDKNQYQYMLEGFNEDWINAGNSRSASYTNLGNGTYHFKVKGSNNNQVWNEEGYELEIKVLPPPWASNAAFALYGLIIAGLLLLFRWVILTQNRLKHNLRIAQIELEKDHELTELKSRFFANITHELRTPLTLIIGPVEDLLSKKINDQSKVQDYLLHIRQNALRLLDLVSRLLDFRKIEAGGLQLEAAEGNMVKFAKEVFLSYQDYAEHEKINYQFLSSVDDIQLYFDRDKMEMVLMNLLSNAFKFSEEGGKVEVQIVELPPDKFPQKGDWISSNGGCEIRVIDDGRGIPQKEMEKIFNRFYQVAKAESVKMVGTGIGLSMVKDIIELHKGKILLESEEGRGSSFFIRLPKGKSHLSQHEIIQNFKNSEHTSHYAEAGAGDVNPEYQSGEEIFPAESPASTILIVEDNWEIRRFIAEIFEREGLKCLQAVDGEEGIKLAREHLPDLIISDIIMPGSTGIDLCSTLKNDDQTAHIPIVLLTARTSNVYKARGFTSGADAYVTKPFNSEVLLAQVNSLLNSRQKVRDYYSRKITLQPTDVQIDSEEEKFLTEAIAYVEKNLQNEDFNVPQFCREMAMSQSTLYRKIKTLTGQTINEFVRSIRLKRAAQLLKQGEWTVTEIAFSVGFNDLKYFRKCFREQFGEVPSKYVETQWKKNQLT